jgi:hypothetical protein
MAPSFKGLYGSQLAMMPRDSKRKQLKRRKECDVNGQRRKRDARVREGVWGGPHRLLV